MYPKHLLPCLTLSRSLSHTRTHTHTHESFRTLKELARTRDYAERSLHVAPSGLSRCKHKNAQKKTLRLSSSRTHTPRRLSRSRSDLRFRAQMISRNLSELTESSRWRTNGNKGKVDLELPRLLDIVRSRTAGMTKLLLSGIHADEERRHRWPRPR